MREEERREIERRDREKKRGKKGRGNADESFQLEKESKSEKVSDPAAPLFFSGPSFNTKHGTFDSKKKS